jgi:DNA-binding beta-propeller fold protein YncE
VDGVAEMATFKSPSSVAVATNGNVYVVDGQSYTIRQITPAGVVSTIAGLAGVRNTPQSLAFGCGYAPAGEGFLFSGEV